MTRKHDESCIDQDAIERLIVETRLMGSEYEVRVGDHVVPIGNPDSAAKQELFHTKIKLADGTTVDCAG